MAVGILNGCIKVNSIRNNSHLNQGKSVANGWSITEKTNFMIGQIAGNLNLIPSGVNILSDPDLDDSPEVNTIASSTPTGGSNFEVV